MISILKITKGNNSAKDTISILTIYKITKWHKTEKNVEGVTVQNQSLVILLFVPSFIKLSQTVSKYRADTICIPKIKKGNNSAKMLVE